tara:strand:+ start:369 stop:611 length:243 start_codon:yes stop_codon:yes gene_type:complete
MLKSIILYITLTISPPAGNFEKIIELNMSFTSMHDCEVVAEDISVNTDLLFQVANETVEVKARCVDLYEMLEREIEEVRG